MDNLYPNYDLDETLASRKSIEREFKKNILDLRRKSMKAKIRIKKSPNVQRRRVNRSFGASSSYSQGVLPFFLIILEKD